MAAPLGPSGPKDQIPLNADAAKPSEGADKSTGKALGKNWREFVVEEMKSAWKFAIQNLESMGTWLKTSLFSKSVFSSDKATQPKTPSLSAKRVSVINPEAADNATVARNTALNKLGIPSNPQSTEELDRAIAKLSERNDDLAIKLKLLKDQEAKIPVLKRKIDEARGQVDEKELEIRALVPSFQKLQSEIDKGKGVSAQLTNFQQGIATLTSDIAKLKMEIEKNTAASWDPQEMADKHEAEISINNHTIERLMAQRAKLEPPIVEGNIPQANAAKGEGEVVTAEVSSSDIPVDEPVVNAALHEEVKTSEGAPSSIVEPQTPREQELERVKKATIKLTEIEAKIPQLNARVLQLTESQRVQQGKIQEFEQQIKDKQIYLRGTVSNLEQRRARASADTTEQDAIINVQTNARDELQREADRLQKKTEAAETALNQATQRKLVLETQVKQKGVDPAKIRELAQVTIDMDTHVKTLANLNQQKLEIQNQISGATVLIDDAADAKKDIERSIASFTTLQAAVTSELEALQHQLMEARSNFSQLSYEITTTTEQLQGMETALFEAETEKVEANAAYDRAEYTRRAQRNPSTEQEIE